MPSPSPQEQISEVAAMLKTRTPDSRDRYSMKARKGFRSRQMPRGPRPLQREFARKR